MSKISTCMAALFVLFLAGTARSDEEKIQNATFGIEINTNVTATLRGERRRIQIHTELGIRRERSDSSKAVKLFDRGRATIVKVDGLLVYDSVVDADKIIVKNPDGTHETYLKDLPAEEKAKHQARFVHPLATITVNDKEGEAARELNKDIYSGDSDEGLIGNFMLMHGKFLQAKGTWEEEHCVGIGDYVMRGKLQQETVGALEDNARQFRVKISGTLKLENLKFSPEIILDTKCEVSGEKIYDLDKQDYVSGSLELKHVGNTTEASEVKGSLVGTTQLTLSLKDESKKDP